MSIAIALTLLAEAAATCAPGEYRLGGEARFVRPVGTFEAAPFERLGPVESVVSRPADVQQAAAPEPDSEAEGEQPAEPCAAPVSIA